MLVGLAVHGHQWLGDLGELGGRHRGAADERPRASLGGDGAGQQHPAVLGLAAELVDGGRERRAGTGADHALDAGGLGAGAHGAGVGAAAQEQAEGGDDHGLARAGLTGDHGQAGAEL